MINWTESQNKAIQKRDTDLLVAASAGSGKTTVMIERIASMVESKEVNIDGLLVLTFTNASAADMKRKLMRKLDKPLDGAFIGTFHKFCGDLVRMYFNIAGIIPNFEILEDADTMKKEIAEKIILGNYDMLGTVIDTFCVNRKLDGLVDMLIEIFDFLCSRGNAKEWLRSTALSSYDTGDAMNRILNHYQSMGRIYLEKFSKFNPTEKMKPCIVECIERSTMLSRVGSYDDLHKIALMEGYRRLNPCKEFGEYELFRKIRDDFKKITGKITDGYSLTYEQIKRNGKQDRKLVQGVIELVTAFDDEYTKTKIDNGLLDFNDLEKYACKVLENDEVANNIRDKYRYIFVDEYQDTSPMQDSILSRVVGDENIFMVGDVKQSIYGFRGCESRIFESKMKCDRNEVVLLNENFRSDPNILRFANLVFSQIMDGYAENSAFNVTGDGREKVEVVLIEKGNAGQQAAVIADKISQMDCRLSDIAVLSRNRNNYDVLTKTLGNVGIPFVTDTEINASELPEIALIENMLFAVSNHYNDVPLVLLMSSFVFGFTADRLADISMREGDCFYKKLDDGEQFFKDFLHKYYLLSKTLDVAELVTVFMTEYKINPSASVYSYLDAVRGKTIPKFLYQLENEDLEIKIKQSSSADAVKIMTMHSSKGLEFPAVFVFDVGAQFNTSDARRLMVVDKDCGLCVYSLEADEFTKTHSIARHSAVIALHDTMMQEEIRLLYVALTRAKNKMFILGNTQGRGHLDMLRPALDRRDPCFDLTVLDNVEIVEDKKEVRLLSGKVDEKLVGELTGIYNRKYPHTSVKLKTSISELTRKEDVRYKGDKGAEFGNEYHKQMQRKDMKGIYEMFPILEGYKVYRELPFLWGKGERVIQGIIDLVAIKGGHAVIIDYKTNNLGEDKLVEYYAGQLGYYAEAVKEALKIKNVDTYIYSVKSDKLIPVI